ncbi:hypothetical protein ABEV34_20625 [Methylorubrum rhodesianum]|uniref:hypothetical protein n=1 Tax=Methylorubrum rhodesianum TaxID=29427 RepID=UPI003D281DDB
MIRSFRAALVALATVAACVVAGPAPAQTFTLAEIGLENSGGCPKLAARDRTSNVMVPIGCITTGGAGPNLKLTPGALSMQGPLYAADLTLAADYNPPAVMLGLGNRVSFCPQLSCVRGPYPPQGQEAPKDPAFYDHQRATVLISGPSQLDGQAQEQLLAVIGTSNTGYNEAWQPGKAYSVGDNMHVERGGGVGAVYRALNSGTSGTTRPYDARPPTAPYTFNDGGVNWLWINDFAIGVKANFYNEQAVKPGSASTWTQANNVTLFPGVKPLFHVNTELDFGNNSGTDCGFGNGNCFNLFLRSGGENMLTGHIQVDGESSTPGKFSAYYGIRLAGEKAASIADFVTESSGQYGFAICSGVTTCSHSGAGIYDGSTSPIAYQIRQVGTGTMHSVASIVDDTTTPTFASIAGTKTFAGIYEHSTTPAGINLGGTYSRAQIEGAGWNVNPQGVITAAGAFLTGYFKPAQFTRASLPTCNTSGRGAMVQITDAGGTISYRGIATGGGSAIAVVLCDGANWIFN